MSFDRDAVKGQGERAASSMGNYRFLKKNTTTTLRILEFTNNEGKVVFATEFVEHTRTELPGKSIDLCRAAQFGEVCAYCTINAKAAANGESTPFGTRTRYAVNAIDLNDEQSGVRLWIIPVSVFKQLVDVTDNDDWNTAFEFKEGVAIQIKSTGELKDTKYAVSLGRKPRPITKQQAAQVADPMTKILDLGLEHQCLVLGVAVGDIFDGDVEQHDVSRPDKAPMKENTSLDDEFDEFINSGGSGSEKEVTADDKNGGIEETKPRCFGKAELFDPDDDECKNHCHFTEACGQAITKKQPVRATLKTGKSAVKSGKMQTADDALSRILSKSNKKK